MMKLNQVYLPAELWLSILPLLTQANIRALAGVCLILRKILGPSMEFKVTIMRDTSSRHALRKALAISRTSAILDSVVEVNINTGKSRNTYWGSERASNVPYHLFPAVFCLVKAIPAMRRLHTIHLTGMILLGTYLYTILSSPNLIHLILEAVQLPKMSKFPPPKLRKLTLTAMFSWEALQPLVTQLATSLEYLELERCSFWSPQELRLPPFPRLRELRHHQNHTSCKFSSKCRLSEVFRLGSRVTHLHLSGEFDHTCVSAFPKTLQNLSIEEWMLTEQVFAKFLLPQLVSLSIRCHQRWWKMDFLAALPSFIRDRFPGITSLHFNLPWSLRHFVLALARSQYNLQTLKLFIDTKFGLDREEVFIRYPEWVSDDIDRKIMWPAALQSIKLEVVQTYCELEWSVTPCTQWISDNVLPSVTGLGSSDLKNVEVLFIQPESELAWKRVLWKRWIRTPNNDWKIEKCL